MPSDVAVLVLVAALGLAVGSFLNVCIHRVPEHQSIARPGSRCPACGYVLRWFDNIPVVSYVLLRGRCRGCQARISPRYPIVELVTMGVFVVHYLVLGLDPLIVPRLVFACALIVLFAIDLDHQILPDVITLPGIVLGFACSLVFPPGPLASLIGILVGGGILWLVGEGYYRVTGEDGMGFGDVKMLAMIGAFLGWKLVILTLMLSSIVGALVGVGVLVVRRGGLKYALPFGTFLALAALVSSLAGDRILTWYLGLY